MPIKILENNLQFLFYVSITNKIEKKAELNRYQHDLG
jgi:hypothetical protein